MKKNKTTRLIIEISLLLIFILSITALTTSSVQTYLAKYAASYFSKTIGSELTIDKIKISYLTHIELDNVCLKDKQGEKLASFDKVKLRIRLLPLINKKITIKNVCIDNLYANIYITTDSTANYQFIIDAFPSDSTSKTPDISIKSISLNNARIQYKDWRDSTDLDIRHINTKAKFEISNGNKMHVEIKEMNLCNREDKILSNLKVKAIANDKILGLRNLAIDLRNSHIKVDAAKIEFAFRDDNTIDWGNSSYLVNLSPSSFVPEDIGWLIPQVREINKPIHFELDASGKIDHIKTQKIRFDYDSSIFLNASIDVRNITKIDSLNAVLNISELRFSAQAINSLLQKTGNKSFSLPKELNRLGICNYKGIISGKPKNIQLIGSLMTGQGNLYTNLAVASTDTFKTFDFNGTLGSSTIHLNNIIDKPELGLGATEFRLNAEAHFGKNGKYDVKLLGNIAKATFKHYTYKNIALDGCFTNKKFTGTFLLDDPNGKVQFNGILDMSDELKRFTLTSTVEKVKPWELHLVDNNKETAISFGIAMDITLTNINDINGKVSFNNLDISNPNKNFHLDKIELQAVNNQDTNYVNVRSNLINGDIYGHYKTDEIGKNLVNTLSKNLPRLKALNIGEASQPTDITISFDIEPLEALMKSLEIPWFTTKTTTCHLSYKSEKERLSSYIIVPNITNGNTTLDNSLLNINNYNGVNLRLKTETDLKAGHVIGNINVKMNNGTITTSMQWEDQQLDSLAFGGELFTKTTFAETEKGWKTKVEILPTQFILHGTPWQFNYSEIQFINDEIGINNFSLVSEDGQRIAVNGTVSDNVNDTLNVEISDLMLEYISDMLPKDVSLSFGGHLSAECKASKLKSADPHINLDATSTPFIFNNSEVGILKAKCKFNPKENNLDFSARIYSSADTSAVLNGHYFFTKDSLDIIGKANGLELSFISYFIENVFGTVSGKGYGDVHIYSSTGGNVAVEADVLAKDAYIGINFLNTKYYFTDSIKLTKGVIDFGKIKLKDEFGGNGYLEGKITHKFFKEMVLNLNLHCDTMLAMNTTKKESPSFYGKVLATGDIYIYGPTEEIKITGKAKTEPHTKINLPIDNYTATENSFITFVETREEGTDIEETENQGGNLSINLMLDIDPQTEATIITNSKTGDRLDAKLSGNLQMVYDVSNSDIKLYGGLNVISGLYVFTLQEVIRKEFNFKEGGKITWSGDPLNAKLDIEGYYQLNANIADLLSEAELINVSRTTVPVQCQLLISGNLIQPAIDFKIDLPSSDEEVKMAVQKAIDSPEKLYREIISLLLLGKFIKAESMDNSSFISQNEIYSAVSSTISAQINNWASQMFDHWGFGVNFRKSDQNSQSKDEYEYEFNFQYTPTDRILINGNVGYRDNSSNSNNFIGDFDFEYKLVESGQLRIKAYTHTNDYKEFKKGLRTQGVGLLWTENFNNGKELRQTIKMQVERGKIERKERREARKKKKEERAKKKEEKRAQKALEKERKAKGDK